MTKRKIVKLVLIALAIGLTVAIALGFYLFNKPHRDVQASAVDYELSSEDLVNEFIANPELANQKYLDESGNSKIISITGTIHSVTSDLNSQIVLLLKDNDAPAGVSCTFSIETNSHAQKYKVGQVIKVKGVIRSGAGFDKDLDLYEDVILEKCDVINQ